MPKIIENLRDDILREAMNIIDDAGMDALSLRSISSKLGIATSTIYNYYNSKEEIIGALLRQRWEAALCEIDRKCAEYDDTCEALEAIVAELKSSVKPLLRMHISTAKALDSSFAHSHDYQKRIFSELVGRVREVLRHSEAQGITDAQAELVTKLLITCTHDSELSISEIIRTVKAL